MARPNQLKSAPPLLSATRSTRRLGIVRSTMDVPLRSAVESISHKGFSKKQRQAQRKRGWADDPDNVTPLSFTKGDLIFLKTASDWVSRNLENDFMPVSCAKVLLVEPGGTVARVEYQHLPNGYDGVVNKWEFPRQTSGPRTWTQDGVEQASVLLMGCLLTQGKKFQKKTRDSMKEVPELRYMDFITKDVALENARKEVVKEQGGGVGSVGAQGSIASGSRVGGSGSQGLGKTRAGQNTKKKTRRSTSLHSDSEAGSETSSESSSGLGEGCRTSESDSDEISSESSGSSRGSEDRRNR